MLQGCSSWLTDTAYDMSLHLLRSLSRFRLSDEDIEKMVKDAETFAEEDKKLKEKVEARNELESYVYSLKNQVLLRGMSLWSGRLGVGPGSYPFLFTANITSPLFAISQLNDKEKLGAKISEEDKKTIEEAINDKIAWLEANQGAEADEFKAKKKEVGFNLLSCAWF